MSRPHSTPLVPALRSAILPWNLLPEPLRISFRNQLLAASLLTLGALAKGAAGPALAGAVLFVLLLLIARLQATAAADLRHGSRRWAALGTVVCGIAAITAFPSSLLQAGLGGVACLLQWQYFRALGRVSVRCQLTEDGPMQATTICLAFSLALVLCGSLTAVADDPDASLSDFERRLREVPDIYASPRDVVLKKLRDYYTWSGTQWLTAESQLQLQLAAVSQATGPASHKTLAVEATLKWLRGAGGPPMDVDAINWMADFAGRIAGGRERVWQSMGPLIRRLNKAARQDDINELLNAFRQLDTVSQSDAAETVLIGREFSGYRVTPDGKHLISIRMRFGKGTDDQFTGRVERDFMYSGHPVHHLAGSFQGVYVRAQTGPVKAFGNKSDHAWTYAGCLIGRTLIGRYSGRNDKGKLKGGVFVVRTGR